MRFLIALLLASASALVFTLPALAFGNTDSSAAGVLLYQTAVQTTTLPYEFEPLDLDNPDAPQLEIDLVSVPFINQVGSLALTLFALFDKFSILGLFLVIMLAVWVIYWLWTYVTGKPSTVTLKLSEGLDVGARVLDAQTDSLQEGVTFYQENSLRMGPGAEQRYLRDQGAIASNRQLSSGLRQGSRLFRRAKKDFSGNPFK